MHMWQTNTNAFVCMKRFGGEPRGMNTFLRFQELFPLITLQFRPR